MTAADRTPATDSERDERLRGIQERVDHHSPEEFGSETVGWLLALLAEQAATIERVAAVHVRRVWDYDRDPVTRFKNQQFLDQCDHCRVNWPCRTAAALGSQRTEGQG